MNQKIKVKIYKNPYKMKIYGFLYKSYLKD